MYYFKCFVCCFTLLVMCDAQKMKLILAFICPPMGLKLLVRNKVEFRLNVYKQTYPLLHSGLPWDVDATGQLIPNTKLYPISEHKLHPLLLYWIL